MPVRSHGSLLIDGSVLSLPVLMEEVHILLATHEGEVPGRFAVVNAAMDIPLDAWLIVDPIICVHIFGLGMFHAICET